MVLEIKIQNFCFNVIKIDLTFTLPTVNAFVTKNMSILNIDDYCLEVKPRNNSSVEKDRYLYGFGNKNSKLLF